MDKKNYKEVAKMLREKGFGGDLDDKSLVEKYIEQYPEVAGKIDFSDGEQITEKGDPVGKTVANESLESQSTSGSGELSLALSSETEEVKLYDNTGNIPDYQKEISLKKDVKKSYKEVARILREKGFGEGEDDYTLVKNYIKNYPDLINKIDMSGGFSHKIDMESNEVVSYEDGKEVSDENFRDNINILRNVANDVDSTKDPKELQKESIKSLDYGLKVIDDNVDTSYVGKIYNREEYINSLISKNAERDAIIKDKLSKEDTNDYARYAFGKKVNVDDYFDSNELNDYIKLTNNYVKTLYKNNLLDSDNSITNDEATGIESLKFNTLVNFIADKIAKNKKLIKLYKAAGRDKEAQFLENENKKIVFSLREYKEKNLKYLNLAEKKLQERQKKEYKELKNSLYTMDHLQFAGELINGASTALKQSTSYILDVLGFDQAAEALRLHSEGDLVNSKGLDVYTYETGKKVNISGNEYLVTKDNRILDLDIAKDVTGVIDTDLKNKILNTNGEDSSTFSFTGLGYQGANVVGNLGVQILAMKGAGALAGGSKAAAYLASAATQTGLVYTSTFEDTLRNLRQAGIDEDIAKTKANQVASLTSLVTLVTTPISSNIGSMESVFGKNVTQKLTNKEVQSLVKQAIKEAGGYKTFSAKNVLNILSKRIPLLKEMIGEGVQENLEQYMQVYQNALVNEDLGKDILNSELTKKDIVNNFLLSAFAVGSMHSFGGATHITSNEKLEMLSYLDENYEKSLNIIKKLKSEGSISEEKANKLVDKLSKYRNVRYKLPEGLKSEKVLDIAELLHKKEQLIKKKSNTDEVFHDKINKEIESVNNEIKEKLNEEIKSENVEEKEINGNGQVSEKNDVSRESVENDDRVEEIVNEDIEDGFVVNNSDDINKVKAYKEKKTSKFEKELKDTVNTVKEYLKNRSSESPISKKLHTQVKKIIGSVLSSNKTIDEKIESINKALERVEDEHLSSSLKSVRKTLLDLKNNRNFVIDGLKKSLKNLSLKQTEVVRLMKKLNNVKTDSDINEVLDEMEKVLKNPKRRKAKSDFKSVEDKIKRLSKKSSFPKKLDSFIKGITRANFYKKVGVVKNEKLIENYKNALIGLHKILDGTHVKNVLDNPHFQDSELGKSSMLDTAISEVENAFNELSDHIKTEERRRRIKKLFEKDKEFLNEIEEMSSDEVNNFFSSLNNDIEEDNKKKHDDRSQKMIEGNEKLSKKLDYYNQILHSSVVDKLNNSRSFAKQMIAKALDVALNKASSNIDIKTKLAIFDSLNNIYQYDDFSGGTFDLAVDILKKHNLNNLFSELKNKMSKKFVIKQIDKFLTNNKKLSKEERKEVLKLKKDILNGKDKINDVDAIIDLLGKIRIYNTSDKKITNKLETLSLIERKIFGTSKIVALWENLSGLYDLSVGYNNYNLEHDALLNRYEKLLKKLPKKYKSSENKIKRGVISQLIQGSTKEDFEINKSRIESHLQNTKNSKEKLNIKHRELVEKYYNEFSKFNSQDEILDYLRKNDNGNYKIVSFWLNEFSKIKDDLAENTRVVYNKDFQFVDGYYLPIAINISDVSFEAIENAEQGVFGINSLLPVISASKTTISRNKSRKLPKGSTIDFNFDFVMTRKWKEASLDINTSAQAKYVNKFLDNTDLTKILGNETIKLLKTRLKNMRNVQTGVSTYLSTDLEKKLKAAEQFTRMRAVIIGLGGFTQIIKQSTVLFNTAIRLGTKSPLLLLKNLDVLFRSSDNYEILKMHSIGNRGKTHAGTKSVVGDNDSELETRIYSGVAKVLHKLGVKTNKLGELAMIPLTKVDEKVAQASWVSYYQKYLMDHGVKLSDIDLKTEHLKLKEGDNLRRKAASYAEIMVEQTQLVSDKSRGSELYMKDGVLTSLFRSLFLPYQSFNINAKMRIIEDIRKIKSRNTDLDAKKEAISSLTGTLVETTLFQASKYYIIKKYILPQMRAFIFSLIGVKDDEKNTDDNFIFKQMYSALLKDLNPLAIGSFLENETIDFANKIYYLAHREEGETESEFQKRLRSEGLDLPFYRYKSRAGLSSNLFTKKMKESSESLGLFGTYVSQLADLSTDWTMAFGDRKLVDGYGNTKEHHLSEEEEKLMKIIFLSDLFETFLVNDTDINRIFKKKGREIEKGSRSGSKSKNFKSFKIPKPKFKLRGF